MIPSSHWSEGFPQYKIGAEEVKGVKRNATSCQKFDVKERQLKMVLWCQEDKCYSKNLSINCEVREANAKEKC